MYETEYETEYERHNHRRMDIHTTNNSFVWKILRWKYGGGTMHGCYWDFSEKHGHYWWRYSRCWKDFRKHQWK